MVRQGQAYRHQCHRPQSVCHCLRECSPNESIERTKDWVKPASVKKIRSLADGWEPDLLALLQEPAIHDHEGHYASRWAVHTIPQIPSFFSRPVAIIGDAAHAMLPHQGLSACQGVEDAYVLSQLLQHPSATRGNLTKALQAFDAVRRPLAQDAAERSEESGRMFDFEYEPYFGLSLEEIGVQMGKVSEWLREERGFEEVAGEAVKVFEDLCQVGHGRDAIEVTQPDGSRGRWAVGETTVSLRDIEGLHTFGSGICHFPN